ncbi:class I SAM-dependent DNA methyltransferase [Spirilliplanes yamanashiensis]|uniref:site-specific DNA-methyltransferase (adenine-specific) n=1 Tax=Spirilliplanes yamanashiensis TaxID=42233 RepID=A0A8J3Y8E3_9ACTN|nr:class I SAM-dependent DNA methyltransferase [Spirilliplanes yamanashiensis]MDP9817203.1 methylase of polypeptide subunit release factors [Spirilliplanes yamanashiensis]GIJ03143.1 restriction endonuclease subunit M [Spirilliplanes yamanashiensis]
MSVSDAIIVGEGWISEHYFTTEANAQSFRARVVERRKAWDAEAAEQRPTPRSRFTEARQELEADLAKLAELTDVEADLGATDPRTIADAVASIHDRVVAILGLRGHGLRVDEDGPILRVSSPGITDRAPLAVVRAQPVQAVEDVLAKEGRTLAEPVLLDEDGDELTSAARLVSALFVADAAPDLILVLAGRWAVLAERDRWAEGRYLAVDLQLVCERNDTKRGGEIDRALTCLSAGSIAPDAEGDLWWSGVLDESIKHTVGVSKDLRDGVRLSIEIIANEVVRRRRAQGLDPLPADQAQPLAKQALRFLYRILFLLYAEASPELGVLPIGAPEYDQGYSLDRLRELVQVELATPHARTGRHLYESLGVLFRLVDKGHQPPPRDEEQAVSAPGLTFNALRADLFAPSATAHIDAVGLGNAALQEVLTHLLLSKEQRGRDRGFISYAELGINQLGAVYEGLMSYTGFFAGTDLYEVAKGGDGSKGSWVVPVDRADGIDTNDFIRVPDKVTGELRPVLHRQGSFVFRLAGRERQQSASYYTPEVLTRFTVGQALEELLDQDGKTTPAAEILNLTICEPALGSGAFAIEAVRQLADQYLKRSEKELGRRIDPDDYPRRLQEVKAYLALHNVYGVDLNPLAVELAEISLWLDTMLQGLSAPWFGLHLRRGNSLIGARRAVYRRSQVTDKSWLGAVPQDVPLTELVADINADRVATDGIHHFLLPADGWGSAADAKEAAALAPDAAKRLKAWRNATKVKPTRQTVDAYAELAHRVETLWQIAYRRLDLAEHQIRRRIPVWEAGELPVGGAVQREQIEQVLADSEGAYRRLSRAMDAWTALWFWPLTDATATVGGEVVAPPTVAQWIAGLQALLGRNPNLRKRKGSGPTLSSGMSWEELDEAERLEIGFAGAKPIETVLREHPWLVVCDRIAQRQGFFHWNLDFAPVFARGGFDLQVGNPPWVRPAVDMSNLLAEGDPWWRLEAKPSEKKVALKRSETLAIAGMREFVIAAASEASVTNDLLGSRPMYPHLQGLQPDLYRCFMEAAWRNATVSGISSLIHLDTHFAEERAGLLREAAYRRLRRHWEFINELQLFEIQHQRHFGVNVYGSSRSAPRFLNAVSLYHPDTVIRSQRHDGSGTEPGLKDTDGRWDLRPHKGRINIVDQTLLASWHALMEPPNVPIIRTRMVYSVNASSAAVLNRVSTLPRMRGLHPHYSAGWHEKNDRVRGFFRSEWGKPECWSDVILQGSHIFVSTPHYKEPNVTMLHNTDWRPVDVERIAPNSIPITGYRPIGDPEDYVAAYGYWRNGVGNQVSSREFYRLGWRKMAANTGERTLISAIVPPGATHIQGIYSLGFPDGDHRKLIAAAASTSSLIIDFSVRAAALANIGFGVIERIPVVLETRLYEQVALRVLRLNGVSLAYSDLWRESYSEAFKEDSWTGGPRILNEFPIGRVGSTWNSGTPLRLAVERRQAQLELDALNALIFGVPVNELCTIYRTQFAVLQGYDQNVFLYDANGRLVPNSVLSVWRKKANRTSVDERTATNQAGYTYTYELPFVTLDREADMRQAYAHFERILQERS